MRRLRILLAIAGLAAISALAFTPAHALCSKTVVVYNAYWCKYCRQVRSLLDGYHVRYKVIEVTEEPGRSMALKRFGDTSVPRTIIGGDVVTGYEPEQIKELLCLTEPSPGQDSEKPLEQQARLTSLND